jgi:hypothetical protein
MITQYVMFLSTSCMCNHPMAAARESSSVAGTIINFGGESHVQLAVDVNW